MRILFVLGFANPFPGAGWARIRSFAEEISRNEYEVDVLGAFSYTSFKKRKVVRRKKKFLCKVVKYE